MSKTRREIDAELARLERRLPELVRECPPDEVLEAFAAEAEQLTEQDAGDDIAYVREKITCMLAAQGLIPGDTEDESCLS